MLTTFRSIPSRTKRHVSEWRPFNTPTTTYLQNSVSSSPRNLKRKQDPFRSLHLHHFRSDMIARTHLHTKLRAPVRHIPFETARCNDRRPPDRYDAHILSEMLRSHRSVDPVLSLFQQKYHAFRCDEIQVADGGRNVLRVCVQVMQLGEGLIGPAAEASEDGYVDDIFSRRIVFVFFFDCLVSYVRQAFCQVCGILIWVFDDFYAFATIVFRHVGT